MLKRCRKLFGISDNVPDDNLKRIFRNEIMGKTHQDSKDYKNLTSDEDKKKYDEIFNYANNCNICLNEKSVELKK